VNANLYAACGTCAEFCQFVAISVDDEFARIDTAACMGCGVCVSQCPQGAISQLRDPIEGEALEIQTLLPDADRSAQG
jgi:ferredoxin